MPRFLVAHPHKGWDGSRRTPGEVVSVSAEEAALRVRDGFGRIVTAEQAAPPSAAPPEPVVPPKMSAPKAAWVDYLAEQGLDRAELAGMSRGDLIELAQDRDQR